MQTIPPNVGEHLEVPPPPHSTAELIEELARLEHEQWLHWSQAVAEDVPQAIRDKWRRSWVDYAALTEDLKEADRLWARQVVALLSRHHLIQ